MENKERDNKREKPDWKQWIPYYGIYKANRDFKDGKPSIIETSYAGSLLYHSVAVGGSIGAGLAIIEKILQ